MKLNQFLSTAAFLMTAFAANSANAAVVISFEDLTVQNVPLGSPGVLAYVEIAVQNDDPDIGLSGFQIQAKLPDGQTDVVFGSVSNTEMHAPLLPATPFLLHTESTRIIAAKLALDPVQLLDDGGLVRFELGINPGFVGSVPLTLVALTTDPDFGTALTDGEFLPVEIQLASGTIHVVIPEPFGVGVIAPLMLLRHRRR